MKDQYFGDINDYRKYGLIRAIQAEARLQVLIGWMLTPNDGRTDGGFRSYLREPDRWRRFDPDLFDGLNTLLETHVTPRVNLIQETTLLGSAAFFSEPVPDGAEARKNWSESLASRGAQAELIFLDPDNGLEVPSRPLGRKHSSKYAYWHEVDRLWQSGGSILIYQHFRREKREGFISRIGGELQARTGGVVEAFRTPHVVFLLASQAAHKSAVLPTIRRVAANWEKQIVSAGLATA